ncbi:hypothetical protein OK016_26890 [Vibrio chagasii]|nr:hypothetical protein [Vibrio chagasii]
MAFYDGQRLLANGPVINNVPGADGTDIKAKLAGMPLHHYLVVSPRDAILHTHATSDTMQPVR